MEHKCKHEKEIAIIASDLPEIKTTLQNIYKVLNGNGEIGIVTQVQLNAAAIRRAWWWLGTISVLILGLGIEKLFF